MAVVYPESLQEYRIQTKDYVKSFSKKNRDYIIYIFKKGKKFFPKAIDILDKYDVPIELQMIPVLESQFNANAVSPAGAVGYWQFMKELAREYGLETVVKMMNVKILQNLQWLQQNFSATSLIILIKIFYCQLQHITAGLEECNLLLRKSGKADADYWDIKKYLPSETRKFVMDFIAFNVIAANYDKFLNKKIGFYRACL